MAGQERKKLGQIFIDMGLIAAAQLEELLATQRERLAGYKIGEILVRCGFVANGHIDEALEKQAQGGDDGQALCLCPRCNWRRQCSGGQSGIQPPPEVVEAIMSDPRHSHDG